MLLQQPIYFLRVMKRVLFKVLALTGAAVVVWLAFGERKEYPQVELGRPSYCNLVERIPASGRIRPVKEVRISPDVSGEIVEICCAEGDWVERGSLLIRIRQDIYLSAVERAEALLRSAEAARREQEANAERMRSRYARDSMLFANEALSAREFQETESEHRIAREQLKSALYNIETCRAELKESRENLQKTTIYAPISGYITRLCVELGERVVGTSQMAGTIMLSIADMGSMEVVTNLNENDVAKVSCGENAEIRIDALGDMALEGRITAIACSPAEQGWNPSATASSGGVTEYPVKIALLQDGPKGESGIGRILPGMSASVTIIAGRRDSALAVPLSAVTVREGRTVLFLYDSLSGRVRMREIVCGIQEGEMIEITGGISGSESIVCGPYEVLRRELQDMSSVLLKKE